MKEKDLLDTVYQCSVLPDRDSYCSLLEEVIEVLEHEDPQLRPPDSSGSSGGLLDLNKELPLLILPDLHARNDFFMAVLNHSLENGATVLEELVENRIQLLCLGDGFHAEGRARLRWNEALEEYIEGFETHAAMDEEMKESLGLMELVIRCKILFPDQFHFLKGNHENILNEEGNGNHPFRKFALEGEMVLFYIKQFFGKKFLSFYAQFEKQLPLAAIGSTCMASHAEPARFFTREELIEARLNGETILDLTWTDNGSADPETVSQMLKAHVPAHPQAVYFGGHRPVTGTYALRGEGRFIQIHNPGSWQMALVRPDEAFDPEKDLIRIPQGA